MKKDGKEDEKLIQKIEELQKTIEELTASWKRSLADYQNLEKRAQQEKEDWAKLASRDVILKLLPSLDTFEIAAKHTSDQGLQLALKQLLQALTEEGLSSIETINKQFDPHLMECIDVVSGEEENRVVEEVRKGYMLNGIIIRPAQVKVGKKSLDEKAEKQAEDK